MISIFSSRSTNIFLWKILDKLSVRYLLSNKRQTDNVRGLLVNTVEQLADKEPFPSGVGGDHNRAKNIGLTSAKKAETWLQINANSPHVIRW